MTAARTLSLPHGLASATTSTMRGRLAPLVIAVLLGPRALTSANEPPSYLLQFNSAPGILDATDPKELLKALQGSPVGHAFMIIKVRTEHGYKEEPFGFYPNKSATMADKMRLIVGTPGALNSEFKRNPKIFTNVSESFEVPISDTQRSKIYKVMADWNRHTYKLTSDNCVKFVDTVARSIDLPAASPSLQTPAAYLHDLRLRVEAETRRKQAQELAEAKRREELSRPPSGRWVVTLLNVDDLMIASIGGREILRVAYQQSGSAEFSILLNPGPNILSLTLINNGGPWTYGYSVTRDGQVVYEERCGVVAPGNGNSTACSDYRTGPVFAAECSITVDTVGPPSPCSHR